MCWFPTSRIRCSSGGAASIFRRRLILALLLTLLILAIPLIYWTPLYEKLWLQPLGVFVFLLALCIASARSRRGGVVAVVAFVLFEGAASLLYAVQDHRNSTAGIPESIEVAQIVTPKDFMVLNFDAISILSLTLWGSPQNTLLLPASEPNLAVTRLRQAVSEAHETGGYIYFWPCSI